MSNLVFSHVIGLFAANKLIWNVAKMNVIKFQANNLRLCALSTAHKGKYIEEKVNIKFPGFPTDTSCLLW